MSKLHIKQLAGPVIGAKTPTGAIPVFDGNLVRWSNAATTGLQIPTGTTLQRPTGTDATDGLLRFNTDLHKFEVRENGAWSNVVSGIKSFLDLVDAPKTYTGGAGKVLAVNAAGTALEYIDPTVTIDKITGTTLSTAGKYVTVKPDGAGLQYSSFPVVGNLRSFRFRVNFSGTNPDSGNPVSEVPAGWTITLSGAADLVVVHNLSTHPQGGTALGLLTAPDYYRNRNLGTAAVDVRYNLSNQNQCLLYQATSTNCGATSGTHAYIQLWFLV